MKSNAAPLKRKSLELPPEVARAFVADMKAFFVAKTGFEKDEIAARQLHALRAFNPARAKKLRLTDIHEMFLAMKDQA